MYSLFSMQEMKAESRGWGDISGENYETRLDRGEILRWGKHFLLNITMGGEILFENDPGASCFKYTVINQ